MNTFNELCTISLSTHHHILSLSLINREEATNNKLTTLLYLLALMLTGLIHFAKENKKNVGKILLLNININTSGAMAPSLIIERC